MRQLYFLFVFVLVSPLSAGEEEALAIEANLQARHLPFSTVLDPFLDADNNISGFTRCGDSATWTGHYLAATAYRYKVTRSPEALDNARRAVLAIQYLMNVTGTKLLARCAVPVDSPFAQGIIDEEKNNGIYTADYYGSKFYWVGNTSRDQYIGVFFGLGVAHELIDDPTIRALCADVSTRLLDGLLDHGWTVVMPDGTPSTTFFARPDQQLSLLLVGQETNPDRFKGEYRRYRVWYAPAVGIPPSIETLDDHGSYFKFNLDMLTYYDLQHYETSDYYGFWYDRGYGLLRNTVKDHGNAHFNMIDRALRGPNAQRDAETRILLDQWLLRPRLDFFVDNRGKYQACGDKDACQPIPVPDRPPTDFLWQRSPFQLYGGLYGTIENAGIDYLLPYWMARFYGVL